MAVEFKNPITLTKDSTIYGHQSLDEGGFPKNAGNAKVSQILDLAQEQTLANTHVGGRNLLKGTSKELKSVTVRGWGYIFPAIISFEKNKALTGNIYLKPSEQDASCMLQVFYNDGSFNQWRGNIITAGKEGYATVTITVPNRDDIKNVLFSIRHLSASTPKDIVYYKEAKVEKGNVATDWTPAPEDEIKTVSTEYYLSTSTTALSGGSWSTTAPTWANGKYMWMRTVVTNGYGDKTYTPSENGACLSGAKGDKGDKGDKGEKGDAGTTTWAGITDKPTSFTPSAHNHDDRYYTESEIDTKLEGKANATHNHDDRYYTEAEITKSVTTGQLIAGKVLPRGEASDIGDSLQAFKNGYIETLDTTTVNAGSIQPKTASANIGSVSQKFNEIHAKTVNADLNGNASKSTIAGDGTITIVPCRHNELNFGGTSQLKTLFICYKEEGNRPAFDTFVFGKNNGTMTLKAGAVWGAVFN